MNIGNFFVKIGQGIKKGFFGLINWVKNTAWIQPLLIVGVIFGVILSIKPVINWVGGLLNPDETYAFYSEHDAKNLFTEEQIDTFVSNNKGTTIIAYYSNNDSTCASMEKELRKVSGKYPTVSWKCVNVNITDEDSDEYEDLKNFNDQGYNEIFIDLAQNKYPNMFSMENINMLESKDDGTFSVPTPMFVRLDDNSITGIKVDFSEDNRTLGIERFLSADKDTDWKMTWEEYKNLKQNQ